VIGGLINKNICADYQGNRVCFCCPPCIKEYKKNPEKYLRKMKEEAVILAKSPDSEKQRYSSYFVGPPKGACESLP
jgi:YHS domain-containing protein